MSNVSKRNRQPIGRLTRRFPNKEWGERCRSVLNAHVRAKDYVEQAPAIVACFRGQVHFHLLCARGAKLRDVMEFFGLNPGLRHVAPKSLNRDCHLAFLSLRLANPSALAQAISSRKAPEQAVLWTQVASFYDGLNPSQQPTTKEQSDTVMRWTGWLACTMPEGTVAEMAGHDILHYRDFFRPYLRGDDAMLKSCPWREAWKWRDFQAAVKHWDEKLAEAKAVRDTTKLSPHLAPDHDVIDGVEFVHLNTPYLLDLEGKAMHHCVRTYKDEVRNGHSLIYSLRSVKNGFRLATLELVNVGKVKVGEQEYRTKRERWLEDHLVGGKLAPPNVRVYPDTDIRYEIVSEMRPVYKTGWAVQQLKGRQNAEVAPGLGRIAEDFGKTHFHIVERPTRTARDLYGADFVRDYMLNARWHEQERMLTATEVRRGEAERHLRQLLEQRLRIDPRLTTGDWKL